MHDDQAGYSKTQIEGLLYGTIWSADGRVAERPTWAALRSHVERTGSVDSEAFVICMDVERALRILATRPIIRDRREMGTVREAKRAAAFVACLMMLDWTQDDFRSAFRGSARDTDRLTRKAIAWIATYLSQKNLEAADRAFQRTR